MFTTLLALNFLLAIAIWLTYRGAARLQTVDNAALLTQLDAMEASLTGLEVDYEKSARQSKKQNRTQKSKQPNSGSAPSSVSASSATPRETIPSDANYSSSDPREAELVLTECLASPRETIKESPKPKRGKKPFPKTLEEYEATRKRLPPLPVYVPNAKALQRFDEIYNSSPQAAPAHLSVNSNPFAVENPPQKRRNLFNFCLTPIRIASRCLSPLIAPLRRIPNWIASFFSRPKPPPFSSGPSQNREA